MTDVDVEGLTQSQAARRRRVVTAALQLATEGGYDAVQMRDVATSAGVALGTIYRYFSSKDHLLAAVMVEWVEDLEREVLRHPPHGKTAADRVVDVLGRAIEALGHRPQLAAAVIAAQTSGDPEAARVQATSTTVMQRIVAEAMAQPETDSLADVSRVLGHVWFSCLVVWANDTHDLDWVAHEVEIATRLLLPD